MDFPKDDRSFADLDADFPLGDGTADTEGHVTCPYCGESNEIALDPGSGDEQEYVEDCGVCCRPILMYVKYGRDGRARIEVYASDGGGNGRADSCELTVVRGQSARSCQLCR